MVWQKTVPAILPHYMQKNPGIILLKNGLFKNPVYRQADLAICHMEVLYQGE
jgi:hypothetical protein